MVKQRPQADMLGVSEAMSAADLGPKGVPDVWYTAGRGLAEELGIFLDPSAC